MYVFANTFQDFVEGILGLNYEDDIYIADYLIDNQINFIKPINEEELPKKIKHQEEKNKYGRRKNRIYEQKIEFNQDSLNEIVNICNRIISEVRKKF